LLYHLFIDSTLPLPRWLKIEEFEELKVTLIGVIAVLLVVNFTGQVLDWDGTPNILALGTEIGLVLAAIGFILYVRKYHLSPLPEAETTVAQPAVREELL
jgi:uncharacterized membrane protein YqhA